MSLFFQAKGELKKEIAACLRQGRAVRKPRNQRIARQRFSDPMVMISERPATVNDRAVPGHWEGDLILGKENKSAIGTLVERSTRYVMLLHLPNGHGAVEVRNALVETIQQLPAHLRGLRLPSFSGHPISADLVSVGEDVHCEFVKEEVHPGVPAGGRQTGH